MSNPQDDNKRNFYYLSESDGEEPEALYTESQLDEIVEEETDLAYKRGLEAGLESADEWVDDKIMEYRVKNCILHNKNKTLEQTVLELQARIAELSSTK